MPGKLTRPDPRNVLTPKEDTLTATLTKSCGLHGRIRTSGQLSAQMDYLPEVFVAFTRLLPIWLQHSFTMATLARSTKSSPLSHDYT